MDPLLDEDLRQRARRLIAGDYRIGDLDRLFLGQRSRAGHCACFREIGDFVAHRDTREKGLITQVGRDVFTSVDVWSLQLRGLKASKADIKRAAQANLRLATDEQLLAGCGHRRATAHKKLERALTKIDRGQSLTDDECQVLLYLGNRFIWKPAFTSGQLCLEFREVLLRNGIVEKADAQALDNAKAFICLYALALMHGSSIVLDSGQKARLFAGFANRFGHLEIKVEIVFHERSKPVFSPVCLFLTDLYPNDHCEPDLIPPTPPVLPNHWDGPIEIGTNGRLTRMRT